MHRTVDASLFLYGLKSFRRFIVLALALTLTPVFGQGSVLTLAMVRYDQSPVRTPVVAHINSTAKPLCYDASVPPLQSQVIALKLENQNNTTNYSSNSLLEKQGGSNQHDLFLLVHKKLRADGRTAKWMDVAAGYGQVCQHESDIAKNTEDLQRPGFAYLKASFSF